jgi:hypothetical protein
MGRLLFPLVLIAIGLFGVFYHDMLNEQFVAIYPDDPASEAALEKCAQEDGLLTRFSEAGRMACYAKYLPSGSTPSMTVTIPRRR